MAFSRLIKSSLLPHALLILLLQRASIVVCFPSSPTGVTQQFPSTHHHQQASFVTHDVPSLTVLFSSTLSVETTAKTSSTSNKRRTTLSPTLLTQRLRDTVIPETATQFQAHVSHSWTALTDLIVLWYLDRFVPTLASCLNYTTTVLPAAALSCFQNYWWTFPMTLCAVPPVSMLAWQTPAVTPDFWKMVDMAYIWESPHALLVVACFLLSNAVYFGSAAWLLYKLPPKKRRRSTTSSSGSLQQLLVVPVDRYSGLAVWVLASGLMSTIFHSFQALGDGLVAEALCYGDHGVAVSTTLYFWHVCGRPSKRVLVLGVLGILALALPLGPGYAWFHSTWHLLSAAAAVQWTLQGKPGRRQVLLRALQQQQRKNSASS